MPTNYPNATTAEASFEDESNVVEIEGSTTSLESVVSDKIIVMLDEYRSGFECPTCNGATKIPSKVVPGAMATCPTCGGKGVRPGGLVVPDKAKSLPNTGLVMSVGPDCKYIKNGMRVVIGPHTGSFLPVNNKMGGVNFKICREGEVMCVVHKIVGSGEGGFADDIINYDRPEFEAAPSKRML